MTASQLLCSCLRDKSPEYLVLIAIRASIHKSHRPVAYKETVLNQLSPQDSAYTKRVNHLSPSLSLKEVYLHTFKRAAQRLRF